MERLQALVFIAAAAYQRVAAEDAGNLDRFNYRETQGADYGPPDWIKVRCSDLHSCQGWPESWEMGIDWKLKENSCLWCPKEDDGKCGMHHQSPIDLERNRAIEGNEFYNECIDIHWMAYFDSTCDFSTLQRLNAFSIERYGLKIAQPLEEFEPNTYRLACKSPNGARRWGKIDFSRGFSHWWHLSHIDFHVPSEHTQEGKRYAGEVQMYHWYSVNVTVAGINNEMAAVSIFLESYEDTPDYDVLNKLICEWRRVEDNTRSQCNLPPVTSEYPGCFYSHSATGRSLRQTRDKDGSSNTKPLTAHDIIIGNAALMNSATSERKIAMDKQDFEEPEGFDWDKFIASQYRQADQSHRKLINFDHVGPWFNYFLMLGVRTEYYYRYSGTQTVPPCYGRWFAGNNRRQTNHWRVMKDPLRVSKRQIAELHRLLRERIAPPDDPLTACQPDTGGKLDPSDPTKISVARPLQSTRKVHFKVFCECVNWKSKWIEDQEWCKQDKMKRFYDHPYNFKTDGF